MADDAAAIARLATGIQGLDTILDGGLLRGGVYIVQGPPGAGKTILGNQVCFHTAATGGHAVYLTLLAESHTRMLAHLRRMRFFDPRPVGNQLYYVSGFKVLEAEGLAGLLKVIRAVVSDRKATLLVLDGLVSAEDAAETDQALGKFIHELQTFTATVGTTVVLLGSTARRRPFHPEDTMVDGIVELSDDLSELRARRRIQVRKLRGSHQIGGQHSLEISDAGLRVHPRIETQLVGPGAVDRRALALSTARAPFGIPRLDEMLGGGLPGASLTMVLGPSGSGKTLLGLQFLAEGARRQEPSLFFGFYERPRTLLEKGDRIGLRLSEAARSGVLEVVWQPPVEAVIDVLGDRLLAAVRRRPVRRLFIDGIQGFQLAAEFPGRVRSVFSAFSEELEAAGVTTIYSMETADLFGPRIEAPITGLSPITQNIILLRHVELRSQLHRLISVMKVRDSGHDGSLREFRINDDGIRVADTFDSAEQILSGSATPVRRPATPPSRRPASPGKPKRGGPRRR